MSDDDERDITGADVWRDMRAARQRLAAFAERTGILEPGESAFLIQRYDPNGSHRHVIAAYLEARGIDPDDVYSCADELAKRLAVAGYDIVPIEAMEAIGAALTGAEAERDRLREAIEASRPAQLANLKVLVDERDRLRAVVQAALGLMLKHMIDCHDGGCEKCAAFGEVYPQHLIGDGEAT